MSDLLGQIRQKQEEARSYRKKGDALRKVGREDAAREAFNAGADSLKAALDMLKPGATQIAVAKPPLDGEQKGVLDELGLHDDPLLKVAIELEKIALQDEYFIEKKLYPNIDFYSGITLKALGFPSSMFTVLFAVARTVGWIAQWKEMLEDPHQKIGRPRQVYTGPTERKYVPMGQRK